MTDSQFFPEGEKLLILLGINPTEENLEERLARCTQMTPKQTPSGVAYHPECIFRRAQILPVTWHSKIGDIEGKKMPCPKGACDLELIVKKIIPYDFQDAFNRIMVGLEESRSNPENVQRKIKAQFDLWKSARGEEGTEQRAKYEQWIQERIDQPYEEWFKQSFVWNERRVEYAVLDLYIRKRLRDISPNELDINDDDSIKEHLSTRLDLRFQLTEQRFYMTRDWDRIIKILHLDERTNLAPDEENFLGEGNERNRMYFGYKKGRMFALWRESYTAAVHYMFDKNKEMYLEMARQ